MGQLDVHNVPGLSVQLLTPGWVEYPFGLFHQAVVALVVPAREALRVVTLGVQVALENAIRIEAIAVASDMAVKIALLQGLTQRHVIKWSEAHLEAHAGPHLLDDLGALAI